MALLEVRGLHTVFPTPFGSVRACNDVSFDVQPGEVLGIVGESGSGKTLTALSVLRLVPPPGRVEAGSIRFAGEELIGASEARLRQLRGRDIGMVFQDAGRALDPVHTVAAQLREAAADKRADTAALLGRVGLDARLALRYPHELSGGQRQRAMIAIAIARNPRLVIADEPTTAVDSISQIQVLRELVRIQRDLGCALIVISHNLGLISRLADRVIVMYLGRVMEQNAVSAFVGQPRHPYAQALLAATPSLDTDRRSGRLAGIRGTPARMTEIPPGCSFHPRCAHALAQCAIDVPAWERYEDGSGAACHLLSSAVSDTAELGASLALATP
ncbi:MAG TPA: ABC transporter ATP-binding protein [Chloroflexota bacterium]|nr:ABC transporter ATP-binding protein [Chloroflexota bacterium]